MTISFGRVLFILVTVSTLAIGILIWWHSPTLFEYVIHTQLQKSSLSMTEFAMRRPTFWKLKIDKISLKSDSVDASIFDVELTPVAGDQPGIFLNVRRIEFSIDDSVDGSQASLDWRTLFESVNSLWPSLPAIARVDQVLGCTPTCVSASVSWVRTATDFVASFKVPGQELDGHIRLQRRRIGLDLVGYGGRKFHVETKMEKGAEKLHVSGRVRLDAGSDPVNLESQDASFFLDVLSVNAELSAELPLDSFVELKSVQAQINGRVKITADIVSQFEIANSTISSQQQIGVDLKIKDGAVQAVLKEAITAKIINPALHQASVTLAADSTCTVHLDGAGADGITCVIPRLGLAGEIDAFTADVSLDAIEFELNGSAWQLRSTAEVTLSDGLRSVITAPLEVLVDQDKVNVETRSGNFLGVQEIELSISHDIQTEQGQFVIRLKRPATEVMGILDYVQFESLDINAGEFSIDARLNWDSLTNIENLDFTASLAAETLDLSYGDYQFSSGSFDMALAGWPQIRSSQAVNMSWQRFSIGVPIDDLRVKFDLDLDPVNRQFKITGRKLDARLLGGKIESQDFDYEVSSTTGHLNLNLNSLELDKILALEEEEFESSGKISGSVPVHIESGKLSVVNGAVFALEPGGVIRYRPNSSVRNLVSENQSLKLVVDAMADFHYYSLEAEIEYSPEGQLIAKTGLRGSNPDYENGREIHLNINLEENVAALLKSLRLSQDLADQIDRKAKKGVR